MTDFSNLPTEIWLIIASDLSYDELFKLRSLNSFFFNCWMDTEWKNIRVYMRDRCLRLLRRVVDPFVANRPKALSIHLESQKSILNMITPLLHSLNLLPNIASLQILTPTRVTSHDLATLFQTITSSSIARKLQDLTLMGRMETFAWLWEYSAHNIPFRNLTKLSLQLYASDYLTAQTHPSLTLEPFFRSLSPTLRSLSISNFPLTLDLSPLFDALFRSLSQTESSVFPNLKFLDLFLNKSFQSSPDSLRRFLLTHNNLYNLHLGIKDDNLDVWFGHLINDNYQLPFLQTLSISPPTTQAGLSVLLALIKRTARTLSSLTIFEHCLTPKDAEKVVYALMDDKVQYQAEQPRKLKSLTMTVYTISVPFLDLLARKLPQLERLVLNVTEIIASAQGPFYDHLHLRRFNPNVTCTQDVLHTWKLHDLSIQMGRRRQSESEYILLAVAGAVPALARAMSRK